MALDIELANWALDEAKRKGASAAEVLCVSAESLEAGVRMGEVEKLKSSRERRLGRRVCGQSSATSSTAELDRDSLGAFIASTVELARLSAADPWAGPPDPSLHPKSLPELSLADPDSGIVNADRALRSHARRECRAEIRSAHQEFRWRRIQLGSLPGPVRQQPGFFRRVFRQTSVQPRGRTDRARRRRDATGILVHVEPPLRKTRYAESVGVTAKRALRRLGARKIKTTHAPVVFDPDMAAGLIRSDPLSRRIGACAIQGSVIPGRAVRQNDWRRRSHDRRRCADSRRSRIETLRRRGFADLAQERVRQAACLRPICSIAIPRASSA